MMINIIGFVFTVCIFCYCLSGIPHILKASLLPSVSRVDGKALRAAPNTLPIIGNGILFLQPRQKLFDWFTKCIQMHGHETLLVRVPSLPDGVIISDPRNLDYVFKNESIFEKGQFFKDRLRDLFGRGIINVDGELWKTQRKAGARFLTAFTLRAMSECALPALLAQTNKRMDKAANEGIPMDLEAAIQEITTPLIGNMAFGIEMHSGDEFTQAFDYASEMVARRFQNPLWFITECFTGFRLHKDLQIVKAYGRCVVSAALQSQKEHDADTAESSKSFLRALHDTMGGDEELVGDAALSFLSAGRDTIAQALTWTFYLLVQHCDIQETIYQRTREHKTQARTNTHDLSSETVSHILGVFYESLRLYPPIPFEIKQARQATVLPDGTHLSQGSILVWCTWAMNRSTAIWGDDAACFRPERWIHDGVFRQRTAAQFPVFQGGPRLCLGKAMAETIAIQVIATLVSRFRFTKGFSGEKVSRTHLTLPMMGGLQLNIEKRVEATTSTKQG